MKSCQACGNTFKDHVDFCFYDGEVLVAAGVAGEQVAMEAPPLPRIGGDASTAATRSATPVPKARRSLLGGGGAVQAHQYTPPNDPSDDPLPAQSQQVAAPTSSPPEPAPAAREVPFVHEDDTVPLPVLDGNHSNDPTQPPAPDRATDPRTPPPSPSSLAPTPQQAPNHRESPRPPSTYVAAPAPAPEPEPKAPSAWFYLAIIAGAAALVSVVGVVSLIALGGAPQLLGGTAEQPPPSMPVAPSPAEPVIAPEVVAEPPAEPVDDGAVDANGVGIEFQQIPPEPIPPEAPRDGDPSPSPTPVPAAAPAAPVAPAPAPAVADAQPRELTGTVDFSSDPPGQVLVNGRMVGTTPTKVELPYGAHSYEIKAKGFESQRGNVTVEQPKQEVSATLKAAQLVKVTLLGSGYSVLKFNGIQAEPATTWNVTPGDYEVFALVSGAWVKVQDVKILPQEKQIIVLPGI
jgi:hypothetical protein